jgi:hypothetical protein
VGPKVKMPAKRKQNTSQQVSRQPCRNYTENWYCEKGRLCTKFHDYTQYHPGRIACQLDHIVADVTLMHEKLDLLHNMIMASAPAHVTQMTIDSRMFQYNWIIGL